MVAGRILVPFLFIAAASTINGQPPRPPLVTYTSKSLGMRFVLVPEGKFLMGSPVLESQRDLDEVQHSVTITRPFFLGQFEVKSKEFKRVMKSQLNGYDHETDSVEKVSWYDSVLFCNKLSLLDGLSPAYEISPNMDKADPTRRFVVQLKLDAVGYRLPTEAEWEYACRAGSETRFFFGDIAPNRKTIEGGDGRYIQLTQFPDRPNAFGLRNMHGGVNEWCFDWYGEYDVQDQVDPIGAATGSLRVVRGGHRHSEVRDCRSANRSWLSPGDEMNNTGFRVLLPFDQKLSDKKE